MPPQPVTSPLPKPANTPAAKLSPTTLKVPDFSKLGEVVTFVIGPGMMKFLVHKNFACEASPVFKAAFNGTFLEGETQTYALEDTTEDAFVLLSQFLYTQKLDGDIGGKMKGVPSLCRLLVLAEKLLMPRLQNIAIDLIDELRAKDNMIWTPIFQYVLDNTTNDSRLRRLFVSQCVWSLTPSTFRTHTRHFPVEMFGEICSQMRENMSTQGKYPRNMADFHVKED